MSFINNYFDEIAVNHPQLIERYNELYEQICNVEKEFNRLQMIEDESYEIKQNRLNDFYNKNKDTYAEYNEVLGKINQLRKNANF